MNGKILITLKEYVVKYSKAFDEASFKVTGEINAVLPNGTLKGLKKLIGTGEIDIAVEQIMSNMKIADFSYPFQRLLLHFLVGNRIINQEVSASRNHFPVSFGSLSPHFLLLCL